MGDYHTHLHPHGPFRGQGPEPGTFPADHIARYVETAARRGVTEVCFTEHLYRCVESQSVLGQFWEGPNREMADFSRRFVEVDRTLSIETYVAAVTAAKDRGLPVLLGFEVDYFPGTIDSVKEFLAPYPWDVLIGGPHWIGEWLFDEPSFVAEFARRGRQQVYDQYFGLVVEFLESGTVDVLAHPDRIKKLGMLPDRPPVDLYRSVARAAARSHTAIEINTAGLSDPVGEMYPAPRFLEVLYESGIDLTLASDAHRPDDAARHFDLAIELARSVGYTERLEFRNRVARRVPL